MSVWNPITEEIKNSIGQVFVEEANYDYERPYRPPSTDRVRGSSFVVAHYNDEIYLLTNAHVVENALNITLRFIHTGKEDIHADLVSYCYFKDIALIKIPQEESLHLLDTIVPLTIADSTTIQQGDGALVAGYPLGEENIQFATGNVSGWNSQAKQDSSDTEKDHAMSYIQITAPLNPGNSGGPVLNKDGHVIGIAAAGYLFYQNIGFAIPSRTVWAVLPQMVIQGKKGNVLLHRPTLGIDWNTGSVDLCYRKTGLNPTANDFCKDLGGIYIREVHPNSAFTQDLDYSDDLCQKLTNLIEVVKEEYSEDKLSELVVRSLSKVIGKQCKSRMLESTTKIDALLSGDILLEITIPNIFTPDVFDINKVLSNPEEILIESPNDITFKIDNHGQVNVNGDERINRKVSLQEATDMIPVGSPVVLRVLRGKDKHAYDIKIQRTYLPQDVSRWMVRKIYPRFEPERYDYTIFAGLTVAELAIQHRYVSRALKEIPGKFGRYLVITAIFEGSSLTRLHTIKVGNVLTHVNQEKVKTIEQLHGALKKARTEDTIELRFRNRTVVVLNVKKIIQEDLAFIDKYGIPMTDRLREWLGK